jgi:hypothetical protein
VDLAAQVRPAARTAQPLQTTLICRSRRASGLQGWPAGAVPEHDARAVRDNQDLYAFVIDRLTQRPEVADVRTSVVYEHLHKTQIIPNT